MAAQRVPLMFDGLDRKYMRVAIAGFVFGAALPILLSVFGMLVSFEAAVSIGRVLIPFGDYEAVSDELLSILNGFIYAILAVIVLVGVRFMRRK